MSVISIGEIYYGIQKLENNSKKKDLLIWIENDLICKYNILNIDTNIIIEWSNIRAKSKKTFPPIDSLIAATAIVHNMIVVTRNIKDFANIDGLLVLNPFD